MKAPSRVSPLGQVFRIAKAEPAVEGAGGVGVGRKDLEVVEALGVGALEVLDVQVHAGPGFHLRAQLDLAAVGVFHVQGAALVGDLDPGGGQAFAGEELVGQVQVFLEEDAETDALAGRFALGLHQHQAVVAGFGQAAQIAGVAGLLADDEADDVDVERAAGRQVGDVEHHVAAAGDVEGRPQIDFG
jgi:hypothetical protein